MASVAGFAGALDLSMLFVAYPAIADDFPATSDALLSWVVTVYSIVLAALLIPSGRLADRLGRRRMFLTGISIFGVGTIFSNLVLLGIPLAKVTLGERSLPSVSLVVVKMEPSSTSRRRSSTALVRLPLWARESGPLR